MPSSSASAHACSGPAPPNATSAKSRGSSPCSTETTRSARTISAFTTSITAGRVDPGERPLGGVDVELDPARQRGRQAAEEEVRVGHGRARSAASVAGGAGVGPRALGPDAQRAALVEPDDRAAAGADRVHGEGRQPHREAVDEALVLASCLAADDRADVRRRAAHVERERVLEAGERGEPRCADDAGRGAGEQRERRVCGGLVERREPS